MRVETFLAQLWIRENTVFFLFITSDVNVCKSIWIELRYLYQRHARRLLQFFSAGPKGNKRRPIMKLENELLFLWRFLEDRKACVPLFDIAEPENELNDQQACNKDDDLILVEPPVELIVIDEDEDSCKIISSTTNCAITSNAFILTREMKQLIEHVKAYKELYYNLSPFYGDYKRKGFIWNAIASEMGDKATKLMKLWIFIQTRYEWEISQNSPGIDTMNNTSETSELQMLLSFLKPHILTNPNTVYKQSYYLKKGWQEPIEHFKNIYNLLARMKRTIVVISVTERLLNNSNKTPEFFSLWAEIAKMRGGSGHLLATIGQCEITWLILRHFYLELMKMRQQSYQLTDKWYFEGIITELYKRSQIHTVIEDAKTRKVKSYRKSIPTVTLPSKSTNSLPAATNNNPTTTVSSSNLELSNNLVSAQPAPLPKITSAISLAQSGFAQFLRDTGNNIISMQPPPPYSQAIVSYPPSNMVLQQLPITTNANNTHLAPIQIPFSLSDHTTVKTISTTTTVTATVKSNVQNSSAANNNVAVLSPKIAIIPNSSLPSASAMTAIPIANLKPLFPAGKKTSTTTTTSAASPKATNINVTNVQQHHVANVQQPIPSVIAVPTVSPAVKTTSANVVTTTSNLTSSTPPLPKITGAVSLLNPNEILIELIASQSGNQLVVHGPPLAERYSLSMPKTVLFIREVMAVPLLHNKKHNQPALINSYWEHIAKEFNLPGTESKNNKNDMESLCVWRTIRLRFPEVEHIIEIWVSFKNVFIKYLSDLEFGIDNKWPLNWWRVLAKMKFLLESRYHNMEPFYYIVSNKMMEEIERCAMLEMKTKYNKVATADSGSKESQEEPTNNDNAIKNDLPPPTTPTVANVESEKPTSSAKLSPKSSNSNSCSNKRKVKEIESVALLTAVKKRPIIYEKLNNPVQKYEAWLEVAKELNAEVTDCLLAFRRSFFKYRAYKLQDPISRCRLNQRYYAKFDEMFRTVKVGVKLNVKTPFELNQNVNATTTSESSDAIFPERYISEINMSTCPSNLVVKNWIYAFNNLSSWPGTSDRKLKDILHKYVSKKV
uniref:MADF domain-containing protein n=1 Tax=Glossina brevipalpis TaxID=37001 RepID=A0A1A9X1I0_9MUSC